MHDIEDDIFEQVLENKLGCKSIEGSLLQVLKILEKFEKKRGRKLNNINISLSCCRKSLKHISDNLPSSITHLYCRENLLTRLPANLPSRLTVLCCSGNFLTSLPDNLPPGLTKLDCSHNSLMRLGDNLPSTLTYLDCSSNQITSITQSIVKCQDLKKLYIYPNPIEEFQPVTLKFLQQVLTKQNEEFIEEWMKTIVSE